MQETQDYIVILVNEIKYYTIYNWESLKIQNFINFKLE